LQKKKKLSNLGYLVAAVIALIFLAVTVIMVLIEPFEPYNFGLRFTGLWGYLFMAVAAIKIPFVKGIKLHFGQSFLRLHYIYSYTGMALTAIHAVMPAVRFSDITVLAPDFSSWSAFWDLAGGETAFIIMIIAFIGVILKPKIKWWRPIHVLMYPMLILSLVHATIMGTTFVNLAVLVIFYVLFALVILSFVLQRIKSLRKNAKRQKKSQ